MAWFEHPGMSKKPVAGAYGQYFLEKRKEIMASLPEGHKLSNVMKKARELWKALAKDQKEQYEARYKQALEVYTKAKTQFARES